METVGIIAQIDAEIGRLQQARALLSGDVSTGVSKPKRGRHKGSGKKSSVATTAPKAAKRTLSPEGRKAIADAMKRRWAAKRKQQG